MTSVTMEEAQTRLPELLERLPVGHQLTITKSGQPIAQVTKSEPTTWPCKAGSAEGKIIIGPDFDEPLEDFKEYME